MFNYFERLFVLRPAHRYVAIADHTVNEWIYVISFFLFKRFISDDVVKDALVAWSVSLLFDHLYDTDNSLA